MPHAARVAAHGRSTAAGSADGVITVGGRRVRVKGGPTLPRNARYVAYAVTERDDPAHPGSIYITLHEDDEPLFPGLGGVLVQSSDQPAGWGLGNPDAEFDELLATLGFERDGEWTGAETGWVAAARL